MERPSGPGVVDAAGAGCAPGVLAPAATEAGGDARAPVRAVSAPSRFVPCSGTQANARDEGTQGRRDGETRGPLRLRTLFVPACVYVALLTVLMRGNFLDDAWIGLRCIENLRAGHGFVFNAGERVEAVTNIGWLLLLAPFTYVLPATVVVKVAGAVCAVVTLWLIGRIAFALG
ncbi:MAG: hypothetical protein AB1716_22545, partial [Planctomycetota bacterium]